MFREIMNPPAVKSFDVGERQGLGHKRADPRGDQYRSRRVALFIGLYRVNAICLVKVQGQDLLRQTDSGAILQALLDEILDQVLREYFREAGDVVDIFLRVEG